MNSENQRNYDVFGDLRGRKMTSSGYVARWSAGRREELVVADQSGAAVSRYPVDHDSDRPSPQLLWHTGWASYPGAEWDEEPPGEWSIAVFRNPLPQRGTDRTAQAALNEHQPRFRTVR